jgi:glutamate--cysteine ligase
MTSILSTLKTLYDTRGEEIERWLAKERAKGEPFFYSSVDLRHSGLRLVPVDTNLFPAGFNNISPAARTRASRFIARYLQESHPSAKRILIIPENHTRNLGYLENLATLAGLFRTADADVAFGSLAAPPGAPLELTAPSGSILVEHPMLREGDRLLLENGFAPDLIVMNNDMTAGASAILKNLSQPIVPPVGMGWHRRRKSVHFDAYKNLAQDFCKAFSLDPWLLRAEFYNCGMIDFKERTGLDSLARAIDEVLARAREKHAQYGIDAEPYVFVKADSGTYGMGIMTVRSGEEILEMNKKERNKMHTVKEGAHVSEVIIQEGVPTIDAVDGKPAEPVVYMIDGVPVGGMWRVNGSRDANNNLNAAGMEFTGMCDEVEDECGQWKAVDDCNFRSFGLVAALAALAAARENYDSFMINI